MWNPDEYAALLNDALSRNETVMFAARCTIRYSGRAESFLQEGDRAFIIKADKTILIHQPQGNNPINHMRPGAAHDFSVEDGKLLLHSNLLELKEALDIVITRMHFFNSHKLEDGQLIVVTGTEEDMANMLMERPELIEEGFKPVSREEQTKYGFIDVMGTDKNGTLTIIECKRVCAELSAVTQLRRYVEKIMASKGISKCRGVIAAPKITDNAKKMLEDWGFSFVAVKPPKYFEEFDKKQQTLDLF